MKCSESLSNKVSNIIRRYIDHMKFAVYVAFLSSYTYSFMFFWFFFYHCVTSCMFCILLYNSVSYVFLLLCLCILIVCMFCSVYSVFIVPTGILRLP